MDPSTYALIFATAPFAFAAAAVWAYRSGGMPRLWGVWVVATAALEALAVRDWLRIDTKEVPLVAYLLLACGPTLAAVWAVRWGARKELSPVVQALAAGTVAWAAIFPSLLIGAYLLGRLFR